MIYIGIDFGIQRTTMCFRYMGAVKFVILRRLPRWGEDRPQDLRMVEGMKDNGVRFVDYPKSLTSYKKVEQEYLQLQDSIGWVDHICKEIKKELKVLEDLEGDTIDVIIGLKALAERELKKSLFRTVSCSYLLRIALVERIIAERSPEKLDPYRRLIVSPITHFRDNIIGTIDPVFAEIYRYVLDKTNPELNFPLREDFRLQDQQETYRYFTKNKVERFLVQNILDSFLITEYIDHPEYVK